MQHPIAFPPRAAKVVSALAICFLAVACPLAAAQAPILNRDFSAWTRFERGAWKKVRITTETLGKNEEVMGTSITEKTVVLEDASDHHYQLHVQASVEVAGKKLEAEPQRLERGPFEDISGQPTVTKRDEAANVQIDERTFDCDVYDIVVNGKERKQTTTIYYAPDGKPHLLRRESIVTDPAGKTVLYRTEERVTAIEMPAKVDDKLLSTWYVKTIRRDPRGRTITIEARSDEVPGGVVAHSAKELDTNGKLIRRSTLELLEYGEGAKIRMGHPRRFKFRRRRR